MPRKKTYIPHLTLHKASGQAIARFDGKVPFFGTHEAKGTFARGPAGVDHQWEIPQGSQGLPPPGHQTDPAAHDRRADQAARGLPLVEVLLLPRLTVLG